MKTIINKQDDTKVLLLATTEDDKESLYLMFHNQVIFGLWKIWLRDNNKGLDTPEIKALTSVIPNLEGVGWLNLVKGFVAHQNIKVLHKNKEQSLFEEIK